MSGCYQKDSSRGTKPDGFNTREGRHVLKSLWGAATYREKTTEKIGKRARTLAHNEVLLITKFTIFLEAVSVTLMKTWWWLWWRLLREPKWNYIECTVLFPTFFLFLFEPHQMAAVSGADEAQIWLRCGPDLAYIRWVYARQGLGPFQSSLLFGSARVRLRLHYQSYG